MFLNCPNALMNSLLIVLSIQSKTDRSCSSRFLNNSRSFPLLAIAHVDFNLIQWLLSAEKIPHCEITNSRWREVLWSFIFKDANFLCMFARSPFNAFPYRLIHNHRHLEYHSIYIWKVWLCLFHSQFSSPRRISKSEDIFSVQNTNTCQPVLPIAFVHLIPGLANTKAVTAEEALAIHFSSNNDGNDSPFQ